MPSAPHERTAASAAEPIRYDLLVEDERAHASLYTDPRVFAD